MATKFEDIIGGMVNVGFGAAAVTAERGKEILDGLNARGEEVLRDLNARGEQVRHDRTTPDFARSMSDIFERAGGTFSDVTERLGEQGATAAERILDELILARGRLLTTDERAAFMAHIHDLMDSLDDRAVTVEVKDDAPAGERSEPVGDGDQGE